MTPSPRPPRRRTRSPGRWTTRRARSRNGRRRSRSSRRARSPRSATTEVRAVAVVPAAGSAERFGGRTLLTRIAGDPLLARTISALLNGGVDQIAAVVGPDADELTRAATAFSDAR